MRASDGFPVRLRFSKRGKVRFISHRDVARAFDRAFRIEQLPLAFTQGFAPRPKVSFGLALSVGHESDAVFVTRTRKGRESNDDIRPALRAISILASPEPDSLDARLGLSLATTARGARPREVLDALSIDGITLAERRVMRTAQWIERDGARWEPLEADALARTVEVRA